ncbi:MAG TPA: hypothetical protein VFK06_18985 [Candidatus Angelobacter sp.]|nr:hypothetical protein [Candidatus Angelobacter sp.]
MHDLPVGAELSFTGPWGKFVPKQAMKSPAGSTLVVASDTGITAAIGLLHASGFQPWANQTDFHWLIESDEYFLPELLVRQRIQTRCRNFTIQRIPAVGSSQRDLWIEKFCQEITSRYPDIGNLQNVFLSGDGRIAFAMRESLTNAGVSNIQIETFFNHQEKKAEAKLAAS